jgi:isoquinoline 1-oxidoreductase
LLDDFASRSPVAKKLTYADLAADEKFIQTARQAVGRDAELISVSEWKNLGTPLPRPNGREIVTGTHQYPSDQSAPGILYGKMLRPKSFGAKLKSVDVSEAKAIRGVTVVQDKEFVGVVASSTLLAKQALATLEKSASWDPPPHPASRTLPKYLRDRAGESTTQASGDADHATPSAKTLTATYYVPYVQHAPMEPRAALAQWENGKLTVWTGSQNPFGVRRELAAAFSLAEQNIRVIVPDFGGGFGGKHTGECAVEAARLAQAAGKPVALHWTRAEEFTWAYFRPAALIDLSATLDSSGAITRWYQTDINYGPPGIETPYRTGEQKTRTVESAPPLRHGSYRALAATANNFARESFMDELAAIAKIPPLDFRLAHLDQPRLRAVLEEAAKRFGFADRHKTKPDDGVGVGIACATEKGSFVATCAAIRVDRSKQQIRVTEICQAFECGAITNPDNLRSQNEGAIIQSLGPALREESQFENGRITNASFWEYLVPRFADLPKIDVHLLNRPDLASSGAGETPLITVAPAIGNALFHATGVRVREMPLRMATS